MFKKLRKFSYIAVVLMVLTVFSTTAIAMNQVLNVPIQKQQGGYTCWACSSSMVSSYLNGNYQNYERSIVSYIKGNYIDINSREAMGTTDEVKAAVKYITGIDSYIYRYTPSFEQVARHINNNSPVAAGCYNISHMIVLKGFESDGYNQNIIYNDPAPGRAYRVNYNYLVNQFGFGEAVVWR